MTDAWDSVRCIVGLALAYLAILALPDRAHETKRALGRAVQALS